MNEVNVECPSCGSAVPVTSVIREKLALEIRQETSAELAKTRRDLEEREKAVAAEQSSLRASEEEFDKRVALAIEAKRAELANQMLAKARESFEAKVAAQKEEVASLKKRVKDSEQTTLELRRKERAVDERAGQLESEVAAQVKAQSDELAAKMLEKAKEQVRVDVAERDVELADLRKKIKESEQAELDLRRRERELKEQSERVEIDVERKMEAERAKVRTEAMRQADEKYELKVAEKDKAIADMQKKLDEARRKGEQTSQQLQGEVQELAWEERLRQAFPMDTIDPVGKGRRGADVGQAVCDASGRTAGKIIYESKRTKDWNNDWIPKIREDLRQANADVAVIVTQVMPDGMEPITHWLADSRVSSEDKLAIAETLGTLPPRLDLPQLEEAVARDLDDERSMNAWRKWIDNVAESDDGPGLSPTIERLREIAAKS